MVARAGGDSIFRRYLPLLTSALLLVAAVAEEFAADLEAELDCRCWAAQGQCEENPEFMLASCKASCSRQRQCEDSANQNVKLQSRVQQTEADLARCQTDVEHRVQSRIQELEAALAKAQAAAEQDKVTMQRIRAADDAAKDNIQNLEAAVAAAKAAEELAVQKSLAMEVEVANLTTMLALRADEQAHAGGDARLCPEQISQDNDDAWAALGWDSWDSALKQVFSQSLAWDQTAVRLSTWSFSTDGFSATAASSLTEIGTAFQDWAAYARDGVGLSNATRNDESAAPGRDQSTFLSFCASVWSSMSSAASSARSSVSTALSSAWGSVSQVAGSLWSSMGAATNSICHSFSTFIGGLCSSFSSSLASSRDRIVGAMNPIWNSVSGSMESLRSSLSAAAKSVRTGVSDATSSMLASGSSAMASVRSLLSALQAVCYHYASISWDHLANAVSSAYHTKHARLAMIGVGFFVLVFGLWRRCRSAPRGVQHAPTTRPPVQYVGPSESRTPSKSPLRIVVRVCVSTLCLVFVLVGLLTLSCCVWFAVRVAQRRRHADLLWHMPVVERALQAASLAASDYVATAQDVLQSAYAMILSASLGEARWNAAVSLADIGSMVVQCVQDCFSDATSRAHATAGSVYAVMLSMALGEARLDFATDLAMHSPARAMFGQELDLGIFGQAQDCLSQMWRNISGKSALGEPVHLQAVTGTACAHDVDSCAAIWSAVTGDAIDAQVLQLVALSDPWSRAAALCTVAVISMACFLRLKICWFAKATASPGLATAVADRIGRDGKLGDATANLETEGTAPCVGEEFFIGDSVDNGAEEAKEFFIGDAEDEIWEGDACDAAGSRDAGTRVTAAGASCPCDAGDVVGNGERGICGTEHGAACEGVGRDAHGDGDTHGETQDAAANLEMGGCVAKENAACEDDAGDSDQACDASVGVTEAGPDARSMEGNKDAPAGDEGSFCKVAQAVACRRVVSAFGMAQACGVPALVASRPRAGVASESPAICSTPCGASGFGASSDVASDLEPSAMVAGHVSPTRRRPPPLSIIV